MTTRASVNPDLRKQQILSAQLTLLYRNRNVGALVTLIATGVLARLQWGAAPRKIIIGWCIYMLAVCAARFALGLSYSRAAGKIGEIDYWAASFSLGAALAGAGWGAAGILLYPEANLSSQLFLVFILGGMMLGAVTLLAPWRAAFLAFLLLTGLPPAGRLLFQGILRGDERHLAMGAMACLFTFALLVTAWRIHGAMLAALKLQFENQDLVEDLRAANSHAGALNEHLEVRVQERTVELLQSTEQLRAEIAQRQQVEEELLRARKLESLGVLAGGIAHDFNNFLTVVRGNIEMARMQLGSGDPVQAILSQIEGACGRAAFLSSQLLTFAKGGVPVRRLVDAAKVVRDAIHLARAGAQTTFDVSIADDLRSVEADPGQIVQALHNILLNARQSMPEGGIVEVHAGNVAVPEHSSAHGSIRISIRDYGCGIPADILPRIFDPYFTTRSGASGLGLATAYAIVAKHNGAISVESEAGNGTVFIIDLPASDQNAPPPPAVAAGVRHGAGRLLIMDDDDALRQLLQTVLTSLGYEVRLARDGAEAIALCEDAKANGVAFDAALLDLTVSGGMGGLETAPRLRELDPSIRLIVSSGYSDAPVMSDFRKYGFDDVIPKPWALAQVSEVFRRLVAVPPSAQLQ